MTPGTADRRGRAAVRGIASATDRDHTVAELRDLMQDPINRHRMRAMLAEELGATDIGRMHDHEILDLIAARLNTGILRMTPLPIRPAPVGPAVLRQEEEEGAGEAAAVDSSSFWIGIELLDEADQPVPDARYQVTFPGGRVSQGRLDANGVASFPNLPTDGECIVSFPDLDKEAWDRA